MAGFGEQFVSCKMIFKKKSGQFGVSTALAAKKMNVEWLFWRIL
jgi:hypothetical protein